MLIRSLNSKTKAPLPEYKSVQWKLGSANLLRGYNYPLIQLQYKEFVGDSSLLSTAASIIHDSQDYVCTFECRV